MEQAKYQHSAKIPLTYFMALVLQYETHQKTRGFLIFSGYIEREQRHEMVISSSVTYFVTYISN